MDEVLKNLEARDDNIYRVIFESEPIDASIRRAGSGGVNQCRTDHQYNPKAGRIIESYLYSKQILRRNRNTGEE